MCDTQVLIADNGVWFAKNSDREPHEPQAVVRFAAVRGDTAEIVRATYIDVPQVPDRHAVILSKPCWIWGAEMGVNEHGLAIGNEAVFTKQKTLEPALLGMDLLRLALERAKTCDEAIAVITQLLEAHGQGGPAGFADKSFCYDSSFIIADPHGAYVLETAGRDWVVRTVEGYDAISNAISSTDNYQRSSTQAQGHFNRHDTWLLPFFGGSHQRRELSQACLAKTSRLANPGFADIAAQLRTHADHQDDPLSGSNRDLCMHATGPIRRSQTTGSMICRLTEAGPRILVTGTSAPCVSVFRPVSFDHPHAVLSPRADQAAVWQRWNPVIANALYDSEYRDSLRARIQHIEALVLPAWQDDDSQPQELETALQGFDSDVLQWPRQARPSGLRSADRIWKPYLTN